MFIYRVESVSALGVQSCVQESLTVDLSGPSRASRHELSLGALHRPGKVGTWLLGRPVAFFPQAR